MVARFPVRIFLGGAFVLAGCGSSATGPSTGTTVTSIALTPATDSVVPQQTLALSATAKDADGNAVSGATISWSVTPASVATVNMSGVLTGTAPGTATVTALSGGKSATATITVLHGGMVGPAGATVVGPGGIATLVIPAGALATTMPISVQPMSMPPPATGLVSATATDFGPTGTQFAQPVTVKLHYEPDQLPSGVDASQLQLFLRSGNTWSVVPGSSVDTAAHVVTGTTTHFSGYVACVTTCLGGTPSIYLNAFDSAAVAPGGSYAYTSEAGVIAYLGPITLDVSELPDGVTASVSTPQRTNDSLGGYYETFSVTVSVSHTAALGRYTFVVRATGSPSALTTAAPVILAIVNPGYTITPAPASVSVVQGASGGSTLTLARTAFPASIALSAENLPSGVTATFSPSSTTGNASTLTLAASSTATPGAYAITVRGKANGLADVTTPIALTVFPLSGFALSGTPTFANVPQNGSASTGVQVTRAPGFTGTITYAVSGLPTGLTATITPTSVTDSLSVTFTAAPGLAGGNYPVTITGMSNGKSTQTVITATVAAANSVTVHLDYSRCDPAVRPIWLAYQDGSGAFTAVTGTSGVFTFNLSQGKGTVALVTPFYGGSGYETTVYFGVTSELPSMVSCNFVPSSGGPSLTFTLAGMLNNDFANVSTPRSTVEAQTAIPNGTLTGSSTGTVDVTVLRYNSGDPTMDVRGFIQRGINLPNGGDLGTLDLNGPQSFAPLQGTMTVQNTGGEQTYWSEYYVTQPQSCPAGDAFMEPQLVPRTAVFGFPASVQQPGDLHEFSAYTSTREVELAIHTFASPTLALGAALPAPTITALPGTFKRPQVTTTLPSDYQFAYYTWGATGNGLTLLGSTGYSGSSTVTMATPDLSTLPGYNFGSWAPSQASGNFSMTSSSALTTLCTDGAIQREARVSGTN